MIWGFIDESGIHDDAPTVAVAMYLALPNQWDCFSLDWCEKLNTKGLELFHMADSERMGPPFGDAYDHDAKKKNAFMAELLPIIPKHTGFGIAAAMNLRDYEKALQGKSHLKDYLGQPYGACLQWVIGTMQRNMDSAGGRVPVALVHEVNDFRQEALETFRDLQMDGGGSHLVSLVFGTKRQYPPLQAADVLAYEAFRRIRDPHKAERASLAALNITNRLNLQYFNSENMPWLVSKLEKRHQMELSAADPSSDQQCC